MAIWPQESAMERSRSVVEDRSFFSSKFIYILSNVSLLRTLRATLHYTIINYHILSSTHEVIPGGQLSIVPGQDKIFLEGCGCFLLFQGAGKVGRAFLLSRPGQYYYNLRIIGSIFKQVRKYIEPSVTT